MSAFGSANAGRVSRLVENSDRITSQHTHRQIDSRCHDFDVIPDKVTLWIRLKHIGGEQTVRDAKLPVPRFRPVIKVDSAIAYSCGFPEMGCESRQIEAGELYHLKDRQVIYLEQVPTRSVVGEVLRDDWFLAVRLCNRTLDHHIRTE